MKRKDWTIKKLKKDTYDNYFKKDNKFLYYYRVKQFEKHKYLRKLLLRKNLVLVKKNHLPNFFFYSNMLKFFLKYKHSNFSNLYNPIIFDHIKVFPDFFHKKQVLNNTIFFKKIMKEKNLNYFFYNKERGNNIVIFKNNSHDLSIEEKLKEEVKKEEKKTYIFSLKKPFKSENQDHFQLSHQINIFFNYNLYINYNIEIYKIIIYLYIYNLK